ncbi:uncharacterized protein LOC109540561 isoform X2 [Dendroctonus ponderosae]|uniref:uncharacterized protein LOC109540561 isoform X2 n=1 Tax=Dendroctonus ponderosae TaxID=77166 RepID=UPI002034AF26|nr:uncharacterized protein LOC109540561 isoform X2 [Dendroctonus ponderosae]
MSNNSFDFCKLCCASRGLINMFTGKCRSFRNILRKIIKETLCIEVELDDDFKSICINCLIDVTNFYYFKLNCHQTQIKLKKEWMKNLLISFDVVFLGLGRVILKSQLQRNDENALHGSNYSGKKITVWATENESNCLMMVKRIRKRTRSKFNCVIGTAIAASMTAYFKRNNFPVPNFTSGMTTLLLSFPKLDPTKPVPLVNKTAGLSVHLPSHTSIISIDSFRASAASMNAELIYSDAVISYGLLKYVLGFVPVKLIGIRLGIRLSNILAYQYNWWLKN